MLIAPGTPTMRKYFFSIVLGHMRERKNTAVQERESERERESEIFTSPYVAFLKKFWPYRNRWRSCATRLTSAACALIPWGGGCSLGCFASILYTPEPPPPSSKRTKKKSWEGVPDPKEKVNVSG